MMLKWRYLDVYLTTNTIHKFLNLENWILWLAEIHISVMSSTNITFLKLQMGLKRLGWSNVFISLKLAR